MGAQGKIEGGENLGRRAGGVCKGDGGECYGAEGWKAVVAGMFMRFFVGKVGKAKESGGHVTGGVHLGNLMRSTNMRGDRWEMQKPTKCDDGVSVGYAKE